MTPADDVIARSARVIAPAVAARTRETTSDALVMPAGEAEVALTIRSLVSRVQLGETVEEHDLVVQWAPSGEIRVLFAVAAIKPEELS